VPDLSVLRHTPDDATRICDAIIDAVNKIDHGDFRLPDA